MSKDWMDDLFKQSEARKEADSETRQQDILRWNRLVALSKPIWGQIRKKLIDRIEAFNARVGEGDKITIVPSSQDFSIELKHARAVRSFLVSFTPVAGTITYHVPFSKTSTTGWIHVKVPDDGTFSMTRELFDKKQENVSIDQIDEVILKDFIASYLR